MNEGDGDDGGGGGGGGGLSGGAIAGITVTATAVSAVAAVFGVKYARRQARNRGKTATVTPANEPRKPESAAGWSQSQADGGNNVWNGYYYTQG